MKNLRLAVAAVIITAGAFGAFAFTKADTSENKKATTTFYAIRVDQESNNFRWTDDINEVVTEGLNCEPLNGASCSVEAITRPADNSMPPGQSPTNEAYQ